MHGAVTPHSHCVMLNEAQVLLLFLTQQGLHFILTAYSPNTDSKYPFTVTIIMSTPPVESQSVYQQTTFGGEK